MWGLRYERHQSSLAQNFSQMESNIIWEKGSRWKGERRLFWLAFHKMVNDFVLKQRGREEKMKQGWNFSWIKTEAWEGGRSLQPGPETAILNHHQRGNCCSIFPARLEPRWTWVCKNVFFFLFLFLEKNWQGFPDTSYIGKRGQPRATGVEPMYIKADFGFGYLSKLSLQRFWCCPIV